MNVPYLAMSARISPDSGDRAFVAGMRMLFGTAAAVTVALCTVPARPVADRDRALRNPISARRSYSRLPER